MLVKICVVLLACLFATSHACNVAACVGISIITNKQQYCTCNANEQTTCTTAGNSASVTALKLQYTVTCGSSQLMTSLPLMMGAVLLAIFTLRSN